MREIFKRAGIVLTLIIGVFIVGGTVTDIMDHLAERRRKYRGAQKI